LPRNITSNAINTITNAAYLAGQPRRLQLIGL
jgi:hypothetical protein